MANFRAAPDELTQQGQLSWAAAASLELGERDAAARLFGRALAQAPPRSDELLRWGRANGLAPRGR